jgi:hypothetical protein
VSENGLAFVLWWTLACLPAPLLAAVWSTAPRAGALTGMADKMLWASTVVQPVLMLLLQWPVLTPLQARAWLWPLAGLATVILTVLIQLGLYELAFVVSPASQGVVLPLLYLGVADGFALALCQAVALALWRHQGRAWLVVCFAVFLAARLIAWRLAVPLALSTLQPDAAHQAMTEAIVGTALSWGLFGAVTGWLVWRRLTGSRPSATMPA